MPALRSGIHALISYDTTGGAITTNGAQGCVAAYVGVGVSNLTLDRNLDNTEMAILATIRGANIGCVRFVNTSDTVKQMICRDEAVGAMAAGERPIDVSIININQIDRAFIQAAGHYNGSLAAGAVAFGQRGGVVTRAGVGLYDITLDRGIDQREGEVIVTCGVGAAAAVDLHVNVVHTSDTVKRVRIGTITGGAGVDTDADFCWAVFDHRFAPSIEAYAAGSIDAAGGNPVGRGCLPSRNGAGDYRYAMDRNSAVGEWIGLATPVGATPMAIRTVNAAVGRKDVATQTQAGPGTATNVDHAAVFLRVA